MISANSASLSPRALLRRPTPRISLGAALGSLMLGHEGDFAVVIVEAHAGEPLVRDALVELQLAEVAVIDALFGQRLVELHHAAARLPAGSGGW